MTWRGRRLCVEVEGSDVLYRLTEGDSLEVTHYGERMTVDPGDGLKVKVPAMPQRPEPHQPPGRAPARRRPPVR